MLLAWADAVPGDGPAILTSVLPEEAAALARMAAAAGDVLEIGSAYGYSAIVMALAGAKVTAVDNHNGQTWLGDTRGQMESNLRAYGVQDSVRVVADHSVTALQSLAMGEQRFGMAFVDGDHSAPSVRADVAGVLPLLRPGGVLACHDYGEDSCPGVREALDGLYPGGPDELTGTLFVVRP